MLLLYFSAAKGPDECALAVAKAVAQFMSEATRYDLTTEILESVSGEQPDTFRSILLAVDGVKMDWLIQRWQGTIQWVCQSPYRPKYKRKNWFIGVTCFSKPQPIEDCAICFTTTKSSGAGGQHVNKTESAVRATHIASGITVKVQTERSQHANKRLAALLLAHKLAEIADNQQQQHKTDLHRFHQSIARGNARLIFYGKQFVESKG